MNKRVMLILKLLILAGVLGFIGYKIAAAWGDLAQKHVAVQWRYAPLSLAGFAGVMLTSGLVWRFLAWRMGDRSPTLPLLGAYTFSQMGKYVPGKVMLLLMRIERVGRFGMSGQTCTLSTLLENALYVISGGLAGLLALLLHAKQLMNSDKAWVLPASAVATVVLVGLCHPKVFYGFVNVALKRMKKEPIPPAQQLGVVPLYASVLMFLPCWMFGGLALWASARCVTDQLPLASSIILMGAFALSVICGMLSMLPGGLGIREGILILFLTWELEPVLGKAHAAVLVLAAVVLQRLAQIAIEATLGLLGAALTAAGRGVRPAATQTVLP